MPAKKTADSSRRSARSDSYSVPGARNDTEALMRPIELLYFAYRTFTSQADALLEERGFGRAHHRALHFIGRTPGLTVAELLEILRIRKQSLNRVLRQLVDDGYVAQVPGKADRRQRRLYLTEDGARLWKALRAPQEAYFEKAYAKVGVAGAKAFEKVLSELIAQEIER
jgi:DNA-binding MarR family transcriptional regulator